MSFQQVKEKVKGKNFNPSNVYYNLGKSAKVNKMKMPYNRLSY